MHDWGDFAICLSNANGPRESVHRVHSQVPGLAGVVANLLHGLGKPFQATKSTQGDLAITKGRNCLVAWANPPSLSGQNPAGWQSSPPFGDDPQPGYEGHR